MGPLKNCYIPVIHAVIRCGEFLSGADVPMHRMPWGSLLPLLLATPAAQAGHWVLLDPKGPIARDESSLMLTAFGLMLVVVIPVFVMTFLFAWKYRASNEQARYTPDWDHSAVIEAVVWLVPAALILILSVLVWQSSHRLSPYRPLNSPVPPMHIQVVAMDWKWLFIYPDLGLASVNRLVVPVDTPLNFQITSDSVMSSFFIPQWGGQIYAMGGMKTQLHLLVDQPGVYDGLNTQFSGEGFSGMTFRAEALSRADFSRWVREAPRGRPVLDPVTFNRLEAPDEHVPPQLYSAVTPHLFDQIVRKYSGMP